MRIKDFEGLFALDGYWRYKRAEKKKLFTDKSMRTRDATRIRDRVNTARLY